MERIKVPSGAKLKLEDVFDNLQDNIETNITNRVDLLIGINNYGLVINSTNGTLDDDFQLQLNFKNTGFSINSGKAICANGEYIDFDGYITNDAFTSLSLSTDKYYLIKISYEWVGSDSVAAMNAFMYNQAGNTPYSTQYTQKSDSFLVEAEEITDITTISLDSDEVAVGVIRTLAGNTLDITSWTLSGYTASNGVIDLRSTNRFVFSTEVIDDAEFLLKDRDSTGGNKVSGKVEFGDDLYVDTDTFFVDKSEGKVGFGTNVPTTAAQIKSTLPAIRLHDSLATTISGMRGYTEFYTGDDTAFNTFSDKAGVIGFTSQFDQVMEVSNLTQGNVNIRTVERNEDQLSLTYHTLAFDNSGQLGVNTDTPEYGIDVRGTAKVTEATVLGLLSAGDTSLSGTFYAGSTSTFVDAVTMNNDLDLPGVFNVNSSTGNIIVGSGTADANFHIKDAAGASIKIDANATTPSATTPAYLELSVGDTSANTFVLALDPADNAFKIDTNTNYNNNYFVLDSDGNIGIGTDDPANKVEVVGSIRAGGAGHQKAVKLLSTGAGQKEYDLVVGTLPEGNIGDADDIGKGKFGIYDVTDDEYRFVIDKTGNVGIGINNPTHSLHVDGTTWLDDNVTVSGTLIATAGEITALQVGTLQATTMLTNTNMELVSTYVSESFEAYDISWPADYEDFHDQGGFTAGVTSSGWMTVGASTALDTPNDDPDVLRAKGNVRLWDANEFKLTFAEDTVTSGISFAYDNTTLRVNGQYGDFARFYESNGKPVTYVRSLEADEITATSVSFTEASLDLSSASISNLVVPSVFSAEGSTLTVGGAASFTSSTDITELDFDAAEGSTLIVSGLTTINDMTLSGVMTAGETDSSRLLISGTGDLSYYDASNTLALEIKDSVYSTKGGLRLYNDSAIYGANDTSYFLLASDGCWISSEEYVSLEVRNVTSTEDYSIGIRSVCDIDKTSTTNSSHKGIHTAVSIGEASNDDDAIAIYASASSLGTGDIWAGWFSGNVYINGYLYVDFPASFGDTTGKEVLIEGDDAALKFYDSSHTLVVEINDNLSYGVAGTAPGIRVTDGIIFCAASSSNTETRLLDTGLQVSVDADSPQAILATVNDDVSVAGSQTTHSIYYSAVASATNAKRSGVLGQSFITETANNDVAIGVMGDASTLGTGTAYAGYFDNGDVHIENDLQVNNDVTISGTLIANAVTLDGPVNFGADAGTTDSYAVTIQGVSEYATGMLLGFTANTANTGPATLNVNSLGAKTIKKMHDQDLATNDIEVGQYVLGAYDGTNIQMISQIAQ